MTTPRRAPAVTSLRGAMVLLRDVPTLVLNLPRHGPRKTHIKKICQTLTCKPTFVNAVDGAAMQAANSREHLRKGVLRLSWASSTGQRASGRIRLSAKLQTMRTKGTLSAWSVFGCAQSHIVAVQRALALFDSGCRYVLILEDDATLTSSSSPSEVRGRIARAFSFLNKHHAGWGVLMLGGETQTVWARHTHREMVANADKLGLHYAERVYQSHAFVLGTRTAAETFLHFLRDRHLVADGALAATQLRLLRKCFFCALSLFRRDSLAHPSLQRRTRLEDKKDGSMPGQTMPNRPSKTAAQETHPEAPN